jgi:nicotinamide-nucleotide amidase
MRVGILAIGTELLMGQTVNTNASYLSRELSEMGISVFYHYTVGDNPGRIQLHLNALLEQCDTVFTTGGLGPTLDDITKEIVADTLGLNMILDQHSLDRIKERFGMFNKIMPESNIRQAYFPEGSVILDNDCGTAPACIITIKDTDKNIVILPGPPKEMKHIFEKYIRAFLLEKNQQAMHSKYLSIYDLGESSVEDALMDLVTNQTNPTIATYAGDGKVLLRITSSGLEKEMNELAVEDMVATVKSRIGSHVISENGDDIDKVILRKLIEKSLKIAFVESCTGGLLSYSLIKNPGSSEVIDSALVTYSNESKMREVGVRSETLQTYGAVSHQTCHEMVAGLAAKTGVDFAVGVTGVAGPTGGTREKPVGLVYIGIYDGGEILTFENHFTGDRETIQRRTVLKALKLLYDRLVSETN